MFSRKYRLAHKEDVARALRSKRSVFDATCGVKVVSQNAGHPRFAIVVSTKVSKNAVDRNRVRRQYREICKTYIPRLASCDVVLLVSKPALELSFVQKRERLERAFVKAKLFVS